MRDIKLRFPSAVKDTRRRNSKLERVKKSNINIHEIEHITKEKTIGELFGG